jgi:transcription-repair coupling factor (superfamily II helicase)
MKTSPITTAERITAQDFLSYYEKSISVQLLSEYIKTSDGKLLRAEGIVGSLDAIVAAAVYKLSPRSHVFILPDREEAAYFASDLSSLLPEKEILFFPASYRKPYQVLEIENANILQRSEVLNAVSRKLPEGELIVTFPDALTEKVINQRSLIEHTLSVKIGERLDTSFIMDLLSQYDFEKTDFVYEAGQYAIRGGIIDVFSYANNLPYRIELFGNEVESIRTFDPLTQLSSEHKKHVAIIPNVQTKLLQETRESFFKFIPKNTVVWFKDLHHVLDTVGKYFEKATDNFDAILKMSDYTQVINNPVELFETKAEVTTHLDNFTRIDFGTNFQEKALQTVSFQSKAQPSFMKNFALLADTIQQNSLKLNHTYISCDSVRQSQRLRLIFDEINPNVHFTELSIALRAGFEDEQNHIVCYTDHQIFERYHRYQAKEKYTKAKAMTLKELRELKVGDYVTHIDYGIGRFAGLEKKEQDGVSQENIRLIYRDDDLLYISIHALHKISKYTGQEGKPPIMSKLGSTEWEQKKSKAKKRVKDIAAEIIRLYAQRRSVKGFAFSPDTYLQAELESSFIYEDTPDQAKAIQDVKEDMEKPYPMDRLICGDVGFGKTEIAVRAAFKAVCDNKQVAVLVPTTILAMQHHKTFKARMENLPCTVEYINRFKSNKEIKETLEKLAAGKIDIIIGTHRLISKDVKFKDLGLMIIDEEQKFGVKAKETLKQMRVNVDSLTLTATPIPRTLYFSLMGARDMSVIATPPPNRQPVTTRLYNYSDEIVRDAIREELKRGGQVFFIHNRVSDIESIANNIISLVPDAKVCYAHGQMDGDILEKIMMKFIDGEYDVLVSTNIVESGLDIPNANTIIINRANIFGLSDLHQMRGRVGRSNRKAYCYLLVNSLFGLPADARKRLSVLEEFSDLGDGFKVAMRDLDLRGAGDVLGGEQSGFINDLGFDTYNKILDEALQELKQDEFKELFENQLSVKDLIGDCNVETDLEILIPEYYVSNISERLNLYIAADSLKNEEELTQFRTSLQDRFGAIPPSVDEMLKVVRVRWAGKQLGIEKLILKNKMLKAQLLPQDKNAYYQSEIFGKILQYVAKNARVARVKEVKGRAMLEIDNITTVDAAMQCLNKILE